MKMTMEKIDHINKTWADLDSDIEKKIQNIACVGRTMPSCNKQHLSNIWGCIHSKIKQRRGWVEKKSCLWKNL